MWHLVEKCRLKRIPKSCYVSKDVNVFITKTVVLAMKKTSSAFLKHALILKNIACKNKELIHKRNTLSFCLFENQTLLSAISQSD